MRSSNNSLSKQNITGINIFKCNLLKLAHKLEFVKSLLRPIVLL